MSEHPDMNSPLLEVRDLRLGFAAGKQMLAAVDGISFVPELLGRPGQKRHEVLYWEILIKNQGRQALRAGDWKLLRQGQDAPWELYDLAHDVGETTNLAARHPDVVSRLAKAALAERTESPWFPLRLPPGVKSSGN